MFNRKLKDEIYNLECKIRDLEHTLYRYKEARDHFANENFKLQCKTYDSAVNSEMQVDFEKMHAFSIERTYDDKHGAATIIGYKHRSNSTDVEIREWNLACSQETHDRLVKEFNQYIGITPKIKKAK